MSVWCQQKDENVRSLLWKVCLHITCSEYSHDGSKIFMLMKKQLTDMPQLNDNASLLSEHSRPFRYRCDSIACRRNVSGNDGGKCEGEGWS